MDTNDNKSGEELSHTKNDSAIVVSRSADKLVISSIVLFVVDVVAGMSSEMLDMRNSSSRQLIQLYFTQRNNVWRSP